MERTQPVAALALLVGTPGRGAHPVGLETDEGVELWCRRTAREQRLGQRLRRQIAGADVLAPLP